MTEHGEHVVHIAVPVDLLRRLVYLAGVTEGGYWSENHAAPDFEPLVNRRESDFDLISEAAALLPEESV